MFTDAQWQAIHQKGTNVIVSAGAGSGKTSVLTERVIQHLLSGVDVTSLLILTFTNAAAEEMKIKIRNALKKSINEGNQHLQPQLERLEIAHIQTFDSFCLNFVKKYHHKINISKDIVIGDMIVLSMAKEHIATSIIKSYFENNHQGMKAFLSTYEDKDSQLLIDHMMNLNQALLTYNYDMNFLASYFDHYLTPIYYDTLKLTLLEHLIVKKVSIYAFINYLLHQGYQSIESLETIEKWKELLAPIFKATSYETFMTALNMSYTFRYDKNVGSIDKEFIEPIKKRMRDVMKVMKALVSKPFDDHIRDIEQTRPHVEVIIEMTTLFHTQYRAFQDKNRMYDFQTIASLASSILKEHPDVAKETKASFYEVLVDEYQDTSELQNQLIEAISNQNIFMVGDIKQSIYGFRDANPDLFKRQYDACKDGDLGIAIDLNANFRSRKELLEDFNQLFTVTMDEAVGGVDYDQSQQLYYGNKTYDTNHLEHQTYGLDLHLFDEESILESYEDTKDDASFKTLKHEEMHGIGIVEDIQSKLEENYQIYDSELKQLRPLQHDDIVILVDRKKDFQAYKKLFEYHELPLYIHANEPFFDNDDILALRSLLILIGCFKDPTLYKKSFKHAFMSTFRSFIFQMEDDLLISEIMRFDLLKGTIKEYINSIEDTGLKSVFIKLEALSNTYHLYPIDKLLIDIIETFDIILKATALGNVDIVEKRMIHLIQSVKGLIDLHYGLHELLTYFDYILKSDLDIDYQAGTKLQKGMINMMTIHKSKGLEFPVVYYPMLFLKWNENKAQSLYFDPEFGIIIKTFQEGLFDTIPKYLLFERKRKDAISEKLRLLYVALTRAKETAIVMLSKPDKDFLTLVTPQNKVIPEDLRLSYQSFQDVVYSAFANLNRHRQHKVFDDSMYHTKHLTTKMKNDLTIDSIIKLQYPKMNMKHEVIQNQSYSMSKSDIKTKDDYDMMALGTRIHKILEHIDFKAPLDSQLELLCKNEQEKQLLKSINTFPFLKNISLANIYKEYEFIDTIEGVETLGIIDLVLEYDTHLEVIDYKLSNIENTYYEKQIKKYMTYLKKLTQKPVKGYLYSILQQRFIEFI